MTQEIQKRIEQIRRGEVPEGYKKTKVGIVPADWQEHKLSHYLTVNNDKNTDLKYTKDDVFSISGELGIVNQIELLGRSYAGVSVAPYGIVYPNDVVYTKSPLKANPYGIIKTNKLGVTGIVSTLYAIFHCNNNVSPDYVQLYFESDHNLNNYLYPIVNIGAKHDMKISDEGSLRGTVVFPPLPEQEKIAAILQTEDKVIELQQKKIDELKRLKKVYLSKMFPKKGCNVPEIRFPGFTDPWEQRKFSELVQIERGGSPRPIDDFITDAPNGLNWIKIGDAPTQGNYITKTAEKIRPEGLSKTREVHPGDLILSNSMSFGKPYIMGIDGCIHDGWLLIRNTYGVFDLTFLCHLLGTPQMLSQYRSLAAGSTVNNLNKELVGNTVVTIPSITEQRVLGDYLEQLDNLITLHQRKCDEEKQKKKALMQLLLTGIVRVEVKQ